MIVIDFFNNMICVVCLRQKQKSKESLKQNYIIRKIYANRLNFCAVHCKNKGVLHINFSTFAFSNERSIYVHEMPEIMSGRKDDTMCGHGYHFNRDM